MPVQLRILALTATPGCKLRLSSHCVLKLSCNLNAYIGCHYSAKQPAIQQIIDNLYISTLEYRNEHDHDVSPYVHNRKIELIEVSKSFSLLKFVVCNF